MQIFLTLRGAEEVGKFKIIHVFQGNVGIRSFANQLGLRQNLNIGS